MTRAAEDIRDDDPMRRGVVYFIEGAGKIKIGYSADVYKRLADLRTSSPESLTLVEYARTGKPVERELHRLLESERIEREWFRDTDKTCDLMHLVSDFLETFDDDEADKDGRDVHILTVAELRDIVARPYYWRYHP